MISSLRPAGSAGADTGGADLPGEDDPARIEPIHPTLRDEAAGGGAPRPTPPLPVGGETQRRSLTPGRLLIAASGGAVAVLLLALIPILATRDRRDSEPEQDKARAKRSEDPTEPSMNAPRTPAPQPSVDPPQIQVDLAGLPPGARLRLDDRHAVAPLRLPADGRVHRLDVSAPGYQPLHRTFFATSDLKILELRLKPVPDLPAPRPRIAPPRRPRKPRWRPWRPSGRRRPMKTDDPYVKP